MRLPWVSRAAHDRDLGICKSFYMSIIEEKRASQAMVEQRLAVAEAKIVAMDVALDREQVRREDDERFYEGLIAHKDAAILAMKREGFDPPDPRPPTTHELRAKIDPLILHGIEQIAQPGTKEHFVMLQEAEALIAAYPDRPAEQIADEVTEGSPISPYRL